MPDAPESQLCWPTGGEVDIFEFNGDPLADAVFASCCIPFMFGPVRCGDALYCDGFLSEYVPDVFAPDDTLYFVVPPRLAIAQLGTWQQFLKAIFRSTTALQLPRIEAPTQAQIDEWHAEYLNALRVTFDRHKAEVGKPDAVLEVY